MKTRLDVPGLSFQTEAGGRLSGSLLSYIPRNEKRSDAWSVLNFLFDLASDMTKRTERGADSLKPVHLRGFIIHLVFHEEDLVVRQDTTNGIFTGCLMWPHLFPLYASQIFKIVRVTKIA